MQRKRVSMLADILPVPSLLVRARCWVWYIYLMGVGFFDVAYPCYKGNARSLQERVSDRDLGSSRLFLF